ncbi:MAG: 2-keto-3-deoxy-L-arabinonate dehydratase [Thermomicrobiales bacterium]|nr:2-keto-3-deoxy-L-arabinonate dehydratase [Thermomicrobiales bacterium]
MTMSRRAIELRGCIPILCTPFFEDGALDLASLEREIEFVIGEGATGVATLAIASEGYKLTEAERDEVARTVVGTVGGRVPVVVSADGAGTEVALERARRAAELGAEALMVLPPYFVKPDQAGLVDYYGRIGRSVEIPVIIQDAPQLTGVSMGPALWARLSAEVPTIRYVKVEGTPQGTTISEAIRQSDGRLAVFCGWGGLGMIDALERGCAGSMPAPNFTRVFAEIQGQYEAGDVAGAEGAFAGELPFLLWAMQSVDYSVATAKEAFRRRGIFTSAHQRQPAAGLDEVSRGQLDRWLGRERQV